MSNHAGGDMLNQVLAVLVQEGLLKPPGNEKTAAVVGKILEIAKQFDCNDDEILLDIGEKLGICHNCYQYRSPECFPKDSNCCKTCEKDLKERRSRWSLS